MLTAESAIAIFIMLALSSVLLIVAGRVRVPHSVLLVGTGVVLAILSVYKPFAFLHEFQLTPELLFFVFLPTLIFESAYNINIRHLSQESISIAALAIVSLFVSTLLIAFGITFLFALIGFDIPFILALLFGAIISATDPVAVLALFKEYGAPRRLSLIFEGESIFNDGTSVALFLIILSIAETGVYTATDVLAGGLTFIGMVIGGTVFGLIFGGFFAKLIDYTKGNEFASITLTMVLAHTTFICAELFSHHVTIGGTPILISSIIATAVASLLMGNYGRYKMPTHASEFVEKYWGQFAFLANSLVFILIGMLAIRLPSDTPALMLPVLVSIIVVAAARALSIYPIVSTLNVLFHTEKRIPRSWQHILAWGSLRGALAVTMVLLIPDTLSVPGWEYSFTPKELILALTVGCVFATLFIKATTIGSLIRKLRLNTFTPLEEINYREMLIYIYDTTIRRIEEAHEKGYIDSATFNILKQKQHTKIQHTLVELKERSQDPSMLEKVIRLHAIGIERKHVRSLFDAHEISEPIIKRVMAKLEYQRDAIERDMYNESTYGSGHYTDIFERLASWVRFLLCRRQSPEEVAIENYLYYRTLVIASHKVIKELARLNTCFEKSFTAVHAAIAQTSSVYERFHDGSSTKMRHFKKEHYDLLTKLDARLAHYALYKRESNLLSLLHDREMITHKVHIALSERFELENTKTP